MTGIVQDLRYALRSLARTPGFTAIALAILTLSIGALTTHRRSQDINSEIRDEYAAGRSSHGQDQTFGEEHSAKIPP